jgi:hypothetical protein
MIIIPFAEVSGQTLPRPGHHPKGILPTIPPRQPYQAIVWTEPASPTPTRQSSIIFQAEDSFPDVVAGI